MKYDFYWRLYSAEFEIFRAAFITRNNIFHPDGNKINPDYLSPEEKAMRVLQMSKSIKVGEFKKQINS
jgi:hypothetical protein